MDTGAQDMAATTRLGKRSDDLPLWAEAAIFPGMVSYRRGDHVLGLTLLGLATGGFVASLVGTSYGLLALAQLGTKAVLGSSALGITDALIDQRRGRQMQDIADRSRAAAGDGTAR